MLVIVVPILFGATFFLTLSNTIFGGDAGDLLSAIITRGHAHPPGYSLYTLLGLAFNSLPLTLTPAGKVTLISTFSTIAALFLLFYLIKEIFYPVLYNKFLNLIIVLTVGFNYIIWLYAVVPELFPLNTLITLFIFYFAVKFYKGGSLRYLYLLALFTGLGITHHLTFILVIPSVIYLLFVIRRRLKISLKNAIITLTSFMIGLLPLTYLIYVSKSQSEFQWAKADTYQGFFSLLTRQMYGSFVPGSFINNIYISRLLQFKYLFNETVTDFSTLGLILFILGFFSFLKTKKSPVKDLLMAVLINIILFGPFFLFYANFPLVNKFLFATIERFLHVYYFFFSIFIYFGLFYLTKLIKTYLLDSLLQNNFLKNTVVFLIPLIFLLYPIKLFKQNYPIIITLKNDRTAENLGLDTLNNAKPKSLILLTKDTQLFDTQYIYYAYPKIRQDKIIIHVAKTITSYYPMLLQKYYPGLIIKTTKDGTLPLFNFLSDNKEKFNIYSNDIFPLSGLNNYSWVSQGLLFKLVKSSEINSNVNLTNLEYFWKNSLNKNLASETLTNKNKFRNYFLTEVLNTYSDGHQNSAQYFLDIEKPEEAFKQIQESSFLKPEDTDQYLLYSKYYQSKSECLKAEDYIDKAIGQTKDKAYLTQLANIGVNCYKTDKDKERITKKLEKLLNGSNPTLKNF